MALYFGELLHRSGSGTSLGNAMVYVTLAFIAFSVVFGRLYTGMVSANCLESSCPSSQPV